MMDERIILKQELEKYRVRLQISPTQKRKECSNCFRWKSTNSQAPKKVGNFLINSLAISISSRSVC